MNRVRDQYHNGTCARLPQHADTAASQATRRNLLQTHQPPKHKKGRAHTNESNYCPRLVNWSVLDFKKLYFLFETILHPLLLSLPGSAMIFLSKTPASLAGGRCRRNALSTWSWHPCWPGLPARAGASKQSASQPGNAVQPGGACGKSRRTSQPSPRTSVLRAPPSPRHSLGG